GPNGLPGLVRDAVTPASPAASGSTDAVSVSPGDTDMEDACVTPEAVTVNITGKVSRPLERSRTVIGMGLSTEDDTRSSALIVARSSVALTRLVGRSEPSLLTRDDESKPPPFTVRVNPAEPATAVDGVISVAMIALEPSARSVASAAS